MKPWQQNQQPQQNDETTTLNNDKTTNQLTPGQSNETTLKPHPQQQ